MRSILLAVSLLLDASGVARASTFVVSVDGRPTIDPAVNFDTDCLGTTEAADCPMRAALLHAELLDLLGTLSTDTDPVTEGLFETAVAVGDPRLQEFALRHYGFPRPLPTAVGGRLRQFFLGPEAALGYPAADLLGTSADVTDQALSSAYRRRRSSREYGGEDPSGSGATDSWASGRAKDTFLDDVDAFRASELYPDARRLLMIDGFASDPFAQPAVALPVTGFVTSASLTEVKSFFRGVFGSDPYPPLNDLTARYQALRVELAALQPRILAGDQAAIARAQQIALEFQPLGVAKSLGERLNCNLLDCADEPFWVDTPPSARGSGQIARAVAVGTDPVLGQTVIRYFSGLVSVAALGDGGTGADGGPGADGGTIGGVGGNTSKSGCSSSPGGPGALLWVAVALVLATLGRRCKRRELSA